MTGIELGFKILSPSIVTNLTKPAITWNESLFELTLMQRCDKFLLYIVLHRFYSFCLNI